MTYEEAIKKINFLIGGYQMLIDENIGNGDVVGHGVRGTWQSETSCIDAYKDLINACKTAKQAIEKQIPKEHHHTRVIAVNADIRESICPSCLGVIATNKKEYPKYCTWCGQALDWSENQ